MMEELIAPEQISPDTQICSDSGGGGGANTCSRLAMCLMFSCPSYVHVC